MVSLIKTFRKFHVIQNYVSRIHPRRVFYITNMYTQSFKSQLHVFELFTIEIYNYLIEFLFL